MTVVPTTAPMIPISIQGSPPGLRGYRLRRLRPYPSVDGFSMVLDDQPLPYPSPSGTRLVRPRFYFTKGEGDRVNERVRSMPGLRMSMDVEGLLISWSLTKKVKKMWTVLGQMMVSTAVYWKGFPFVTHRACRLSRLRE